ncbi:MAG: dehydrogenase, partial [Bacteroidetes bacterium]|nr:dehydrogenase [Bacteroidota bacterium]
MKKTLSRNIAILSAIFIIAFSIMLVTNYFQVSDSNALEMIENLKQTNEEYNNNPQLQEQIRELDLLARKAYFTNLNRLKTGVAILLVMVIALVVSLRIYFAKSKDIPDKKIDPIDDWIIQSKTRRYIIWIVSGLALSGIVFAVLTSPYLKENNSSEVAESNYFAEEIEFETQATEQIEADDETDAETSVAITDTIEISKV